MECILTGREMAEFDNYTIEHIGIPSLVLMENASRAMADVIYKNHKDKRILVIAGTGNNGADGLCICRILRTRGVDCRYRIIGNPEKATEQFQTQKEILDRLGYSQESAEQFWDNSWAEVVVDALFGVGLSRNITGKYAQAIEEINNMKAYKYAVDIPSGVHADDGHICAVAVKADCTVTFGFKKAGCILYPGKAYCGRLIKTEIGYAEELCKEKRYARSCSEEDLCSVPKRAEDGNKGSFGKILILAGSQEYAGAAVLAASAAYSMGAGMVKVVTHRENKEILYAHIPEVLGLFYEDVREDGFSDAFQKSIAWADSIVAGPGMAQSISSELLLDELLECAGDKKMVLDADALNLLAKSRWRKEKLDSHMVITPHVVEMARLCGEEPEQIKQNPGKISMDFAKKYHCTVVLKDAVTTVSDGRELYYNQSGNSGMASAGSGDVLAGMLGASLVWGMPVSKTAAITAYIHGKAGDYAAEKYGKKAVTAGKLTDSLSFLKKYE